MSSSSPSHVEPSPSSLGDLDRLFVQDAGYLGWRAGIEPDGDWVFFVAGD